MSGLLIVLAGLPGSGKTTLARALAARIGAVHLRIDTIEQALRRAGIAPEEEGYAIAMALAGDQLGLGHRVIVDAVNASSRRVARGGRRRQTHGRSWSRSRSAARTPSSTGAGWKPGAPTSRAWCCRWARVLARDFVAWDRPPLRIDPAHRAPADCMADVLAQLPLAAGTALARDQA